ncbi:MAG: secretion system protein [Hyphomicrobiales bacterium]|nr:secretion system protein [Hyphomicrobiales bacterium]
MNVSSSIAFTMDPAGPAFRDAFGAFLVGHALLDPAAIERATRAASMSRERFDHVLLKLGILSDADLTNALAGFLDLPVATAHDAPQDPVRAEALPASFVLGNRVLPLRFDGEALVVAVVDPLDSLPRQSLRFVHDGPIALAVISERDFSVAAQRLYAGSAAERPGSRANEDLSEGDLQRLKDLASEAPIIKLVERILGEAVEMGASDIYVEPHGDRVTIRYRVDGLLRLAQEAPADVRAALLSRIKILANLNIAERRMPQDGRLKLFIRGHDIDFRIATIPTLEGESITLRVLDRSRVNLDFESLGFTPSQIKAITELSTCANGVILVTGPTGSGKTTTLYTMLKALNRVQSKIFTVEDPIEYQLKGISQVQVQEVIGLDFPMVLRSILRHHPDMIMIGEIRDQDTARIAVQAALTGHLVLSTLHTNSAAETITRLVDMGLEHFLLGSTVRAVIAQRLVRRLCDRCAGPNPNAAALEGFIRDRAPRVAVGAARLRTATGCPACAGVGFQGQVCVAEIMPVGEALRDAIMARRSGPDLDRIARQEGVFSLLEDGASKVWDGTTTMEEVLRVTGEYGDLT